MARWLIGAGLVSVVPTAASGLADVPRLPPTRRRVAVVHAAANTAATLCYLASYRYRRRNRHGAGVATAMVGAALATVGGALGGHLAWGDSPPHQSSSHPRPEGADDVRPER